MRKPSESMREAAEFAIAPAWPAPPGVRAYATLRTGGVSTGRYASLNLGAHVGDDPANVAENRRLLAEGLRLPSEPRWLEQVHGTNVLDLDRESQHPAAERAGAGVTSRAVDAAVTSRAVDAAAASRAVDMAVISRGADAAVTSRGADAAVTSHAVDAAATSHPADAAATSHPADAAVTSRPGVVCVVMTADCVPVLLADRRGRRVGVAHAGWRGLAHGVLAAAVDALGVPPEDLLAWLGPAIGPRAFEVGDEVRATFAERDYAVDQAFTRNARGRWQADLYALATQALNRAGVTAIFGGDHCTFTEADRFFSHRREAPCGRMASLIWID